MPVDAVLVGDELCMTSLCGGGSPLFPGLSAIDHL